jgi:hypothetical protein
VCMLMQHKDHMHRWVDSLPTSSFVIQIGANDHRASLQTASGNQDIVPYAISRGWHALLLEPVPSLHDALAARYSGLARVRTRQAAICPSEVDGNRTICDHSRTKLLHYVETSNATGNWGSQEADARCIREHGAHHYLLEIASFSIRQLMRTQGQPFTPGTCRRCSQTLNHTLPPSCLRHVVWKNTRNTPVPCACLGRLVRNSPPVDLLFVDAEGYDDFVLHEFPLAEQRPTRVVFEGKHLGVERFESISRWLRSFGYECLEVVEGAATKCSSITGTSIWRQR